MGRECQNQGLLIGHIGYLAAYLAFVLQYYFDKARVNKARIDATYAAARAIKEV